MWSMRSFLLSREQSARTHETVPSAEETTGGKTKGDTVEDPCLSQVKSHPGVHWQWESMMPSAGTRIDFLQKLRQQKA